MGGVERLILQLVEQLIEQYEIGICCLDYHGTLWKENKDPRLRWYCAHREPGWSIDVFKNIIRIFKEFNPDIVHAHQYTPFFYSACGKLLSQKETKIIFTEHGRHYPDIVSKKRRFANLFLKRFADSITAVSEFSKQALIENEGFTNCKITTIYNGFPHASYEQDASQKKNLRQNLNLGENCMIVGYVGSLREIKNPLLLLEAFNKIAPQFPNTALVYIGEGQLKNELQTRISTYNLQEKVFLLGQQNPASPYFKEFTIYALPSICEAASLALLEAMYHNLPVIVTDGGGSKELVDYGKAGVVLPSNSIKDLASSLSGLLKDLVNKKFGFKEMIENYKKEYEALSA
jgi:L-malate glycosyltransferase